MDILACVLKLLPGWNGTVRNNSYAGIKPDAQETRPTPTLAELEAVWPEVQAEIITAQKRQAYQAEADPIFVEYQALLAAEDPDAETRRLEWLSKRTEIQARFA